MKKINLVKILTLSGILFLSSCKKETNPPANTANRKLVRIEEISGSNPTFFTYNSSNRLTEMRNSSYSFRFDVSSALYLNSTYNSGDIRLYEAKSTAEANGRVTSLDYKSFKADGSLNYSEAHSFQYNAEGYKTQYSYGTYVYTNEFTNGNLTKSTATNNGNLHSTREIEYYTDQPAKMNLNWFQHRFMNDFLHDNDQFGLKNKNLPKKVTYRTYNGAGYMDTSDFAYTFDADGYISTCTITYNDNSGTPYVYSYRFIFE